MRSFVCFHSFWGCEYSFGKRAWLRLPEADNERLKGVNYIRSLEIGGVTVDEDVKVRISV